MYFSLGNYGGVFLRSGLKPTDVLIYSTRPGLRIWVSDLAGTVQQTLLFKVSINKYLFLPQCGCQEYENFKFVYCAISI